MGRFQNVMYSLMPVQFQNLAVSLYGYYWKKRRFGGSFESELIKFKQRENFTHQKWADYQDIALRKLLGHAMQTVPFYQQEFRKSGITIAMLDQFKVEDLPKLPFLEKKDLRQWGTSDLLSIKREKGGVFFSSSGSTGTPTQILFSYPMHQRWSAGFEARIRHWAGVDRFTSRGMIGGRRVVPEGKAKPPYYRFNFIERQVYFSAYHISHNTIADYLKGMTQHEVRYMTGYAMSNYFLARFFEEGKLNAPQLKAVITSSEKLTADMRQTFQRVYGCKSYDSWSGVEACGLVSECEYGSLHISPDLGIIELLDEQGNPVKSGEVGEAVCTGLINFDQPLIRYRIGDLMKFSNENCKCGRHMPVIKEIMGRIEDTVVGRDGREMVRFHGIFVGLPNLIEAQVVQETLEDFVINIVTNGRWTKEEDLVLRKRMQSQLGEINLTIRTVNNIPRNQNGKFQAVVSKIKRNAATQK